MQETDSSSVPFGVDAKELPCFPVESEPGDLLFFDHCLWHSAFGGRDGRRYIALKFAAKPADDDQIQVLGKYTTSVFEPHEVLLNSDVPCLRNMVKDMTQFGMKYIGG